MDKNKIDLSKPAFGEDAQKISTSDEVVIVTPTPDDDKKDGEKGSPPASDDEGKVPYSRFKKFHDRAKEAEEEADKWRERAKELESRRDESRASISDDAPSWWTKLYGDTQQSKDAWKVYEAHEQDIEQRAEDRAVRRLQDEKRTEVSQTRANLDTIDESLEDVSAVAGRNLSDDEQSRILDIMDEYTPKDDDGNYVGTLISPDKAWKIYELENQHATSSRHQTRDSIASLSSAGSRGEPSAEQQEQDKNWVPGAWSSWMNRLK